MSSPSRLSEVSRAERWAKILVMLLDGVAKLVSALHLR
jgi:hypothetical protein